MNERIGLPVDEAAPLVDECPFAVVPKRPERRDLRLSKFERIQGFNRVDPYATELQAREDSPVSATGASRR